MGRVLTYLLKEEPRRALHGMRLRGIDHHLVFDGNESEGEFHKRFPETQMELRGLYTMDDGMLSVIITHVPDEHQDHDVEGMFEEVLSPRGELP
jgi:hypothetical protein